MRVCIASLFIVILTPLSNISGHIIKSVVVGEVRINRCSVFKIIGYIVTSSRLEISEETSF